MYSLPLYLIASMAGSFCLLTQFMSSQGSLSLVKISWIFLSKKDYLVFLTIFLNCFQSSILLVNLYFSRYWLQLLSHQLLKYLVILINFKFSFHILSMEWARVRMMFLSKLTFNRLLVSIELINLMSFSMKVFSSSLSLTIVHFLIWICTLMIGMVIVRGAWSDIRHYSSWIEWFLSFSELNWRNIKSRTELNSWLLLEYLVETWLIGSDRYKLKKSVISNNKSL